jgi:hypothetical protein
MVIHLGHASPRASSDLPGSHASRVLSPRGRTAPLFGLAPGGVYPATPVASGAVRSYRTISPLPFRLTHSPRGRPRTNAKIGGIFSAALSVGSRPPGVTWHPALWSPDFPPSVAKFTNEQRPLSRLCTQSVRRADCAQGVQSNAPVIDHFVEGFL